VRIIETLRYNKQKFLHKILLKSKAQWIFETLPSMFNESTSLTAGSAVNLSIATYSAAQVSI